MRRTLHCQKQMCMVMFGNNGVFWDRAVVTGVCAAKADVDGAVCEERNNGRLVFLLGFSIVKSRCQRC